MLGNLVANGETKISNFRDVVLEEYVSRFYVAVDNT